MNTPRPFIILSLPRSRTAWMSEFFNDPAAGIRCQHDAFTQCPGGLSALGEWLSGEGARGITDAAAAIVPGAAETLIEWITRTVAPPKIAVVFRPISEVIESWGGNLLLPEILERANQRLSAIADTHRDALTIPFHHLERSNTCQRLWEHFGATGSCGARFHRLSRLNIQLSPERFTASSIEKTNFSKFTAELSLLSKGEAAA